MLKSIQNHNKLYLSAIYIVCALCVISLPNISFSQSALCTGSLGAPVILQDFGSGTSQYSNATPASLGFSTGFSPRPPGVTVTNDKYYSIVNKVPADFMQNGQYVWHTDAPDHTSGDGKGYMLLVNGAKNDDGTNKEFYRDTAVGLCKGATYEFSAYLANLFRPANSFTPPLNNPSPNPPIVIFQIRDRITGNVLNSINTGNVNSYTTLTWEKYGITFNAPSQSVVLVMVSAAPAGRGNDIVIDDIAFRPCMPSTNNITPLETVCENGSTTLTVNASGNQDYKYSQWQKSSNKGSSWQNIGTTITQTTASSSYKSDLPLVNIPASDDSTLYRLVLSTDASYLATPTSGCNTISDTSLLVVNKYPILKITNPKDTCGTTVDLTNPNITTGSTFPVNTVLSYYASQADANAATNALSVAARTTIASTGTFYIRADASTTPVCAVVNPVTVSILPLAKISLSNPTPLCKDNPVFTVKATKTVNTVLSWTKSTSSTVLQLGASDTLLVTPTSADLALDSIWIYAASVNGTAACPDVKDSIKIKFINPATLKAQPDTTICEPTTFVNLSLSTKSTDSDSVVWSSSGASPIPKTGLNTSLKITTATTFKVFITAYKNGCNSIKDTLDIKFETQPKITATALDTCSADLRVKLSGTSTLAGAKGQAAWSSSGIGNFLANKDSIASNAYFPTKQDSINGNVTLTLTSKGQKYCPFKDTVITWKIIPLPKANAGIDTIVCLNSRLIRKTIANTDWTYQWQTVKNGTLFSTNSLGSIIVTQDTNIYISVKNSRGCLAADSSVVTVEIPPKISAVATPTCQNDLRVLLNGIASLNKAEWASNGTGNFLANNDVLVNNGYQPSKQDSINKIVNLTLTSTGQVYCPKKDTIIKWLIIPLPVANSGIDSIVCLNSPIKRNTKSNVDWKYEWKLVKNGAIVSTTPNVLFSATKDTNGLYLTVTNSINCSVADSAKITTVTPPQISLLPKICLYSPTGITATVTNPPALGTYAWTRNGKTLPISANTLLLDTATIYSYNYQYNGGCNASATITALQPPKLKVQDTSACLNGSTQFIANNISGANYYWGPSAISNGTNKFPINAGNGISNYKVLVIDANGCRDSVMSKIDIFPFPTFSLVGSDICPGQANKLEATLASPSLASTYTLSYVWSRNGQEITASNWQELAYDQAGNYALTLGIKGCKSTQAVLVSNKPTPKIDIPLTYKRCYETDAPLLLQANPFTKYSWTSDEGTIGTTQTILVSPEKDTYYSLEVENAFGCRDSTRILVRKVCPPRLFVPNVITPASQDVNAALRIFGANYTNFEITIFSRWGEVIFNSKDPKNAWDGVYKNENMPIGNYQWQVTYEGDTEEYKGPYKKTGDVTVVR